MSNNVYVLEYLILNNMSPKLFWVITLGILRTFYFGLLITATVRHQAFAHALLEPEIKLLTSIGLSKKQESSRKTFIPALLTMPKPLTTWITINCGKFWKRWEYKITWPASWETYMHVRKQQLELDMEQQTGSMSSSNCCFLTCI